MPSRECRQAQLWLAASSSSELQEADRIRLQEHLQSCAACAEQGELIGGMADLLRDEHVELSEARLRQSWQRIAAAGERRESSMIAPIFAGWRTARWWLAGGLATAAAAAVVTALWVLPHRAASPGPARAFRVLAASRVLGEGHSGKELLGGRLAAGARLRTAAGGFAVLATEDEVVVVGERTELAALGEGATAHLALRRGSLSVGTLDARAGVVDEVRIDAGGVIVRPVGTAFSVRLGERALAEVAVIDGEVHLERRQQRRVLKRGQALRWGAATPSKIAPREAKRIARAVATGRRLARPARVRPLTRLVLRSRTADGALWLDGQLVGHGAARVLVVPGSHRVAADAKQAAREITVEAGGTEIALGGAPAGDRVTQAGATQAAATQAGATQAGATQAGATQAGATQAGATQAGAAQVALAPTRRAKPRQRPSRRRRRRPVPRHLRADVAAIEQAIARGACSSARVAARQLMGTSRARRARPLLATLIAEAYLRERNYKGARGQYLSVWRRYRRTLYAADALYMVGTIELDHLHEPAGAARRFAAYLQGYRRGPQQQGAYFLRYRALLRAGAEAEARQVARKYLRRFPRGQYRRALKKLASGEAAP